MVNICRSCHHPRFSTLVHRAVRTGKSYSCATIHRMRTCRLHQAYSLCWAQTLPRQYHVNRRTRRCALRPRGARRWCCVAEPHVLPPETRSFADAAVRVTHALRSGDRSSLSAMQLLAFCAVKGVAVTQNVWDREALLAAALNYMDQERAVSTRTGPAWEKSDEERVRMVHAVCNGEGEVTYIDPQTAYTVFTYFGHLKRGDCCGVKKDEDAEKGYTRTHRCRHCPYLHNGELGNPRMKELKDRIPLIEYVRWKASQEFTDTSGEDHLRLSFQPASQQGDTASAGAFTVQHGSNSANSEKNTDAHSTVLCSTCNDLKITPCTRCKGWRFVVCPTSRVCPQCDGTGQHACMACTSWRPPPKHSFYD